MTSILFKALNSLNSALNVCLKVLKKIIVFHNIDIGRRTSYDLIILVIVMALSCTVVQFTYLHS